MSFYSTPIISTDVSYNFIQLVDPSANIVTIIDINNDQQKCDYTDVKIDYSKIDNLSPVWGMMLVFQDNLNRQIGFNRWKRYISANFWNYLTTPINFTITLFTAISAGQTGTGSVFLSNTQLFAILFASFILSSINTFFKLKDKSEISYSIAKKFDRFGARFEEIYYTNIKNQQHVEARLNNYRALHQDINAYMTEEDFENVDYIADVLFVCVRRICYCFITNNIKQINTDDSFWYLDGVRPDKSNHLILNTEKLFVFDYTRIQPKSNFFGLFGNNKTPGKQGHVNAEQTPGQVNQEDIGCFINENNKICCKRINKWCDYHCMRHVRLFYDFVCCCECCEMKEDIEIGLKQLKKPDLPLRADNIPISLEETTDSI